MSWISAYPCLGPSARLIKISTDASPTLRSTSCPAPLSRPLTRIRPPNTSANISVNVVVGQAHQRVAFDHDHGCGRARGGRVPAAYRGTPDPRLHQVPR